MNFIFLPFPIAIRTQFSNEVKLIMWCYWC